MITPLPTSPRAVRLLSMRVRTFAPLIASAFIAVAVACASQAEGERCDSLNGNDDCTSGLVCYPQTQLRDTVSDRCCPADRSKATAAVCQIAVDILGADAATPVDSGPPPVADAASDAPSEASPSDAGGDASSEAGP